MLELYKNIKSRRQELHMTQDELAKKTGYTNKSSIATIEAGKIDLPQSKILEFANALETTPSDLMGWNDMIIANPDEQAKKDFALLNKFYSLSSANQNAVITMIDSLLDSQT